MKIDLDSIKTIADKISLSFDDPDKIYNEMNTNNISKDQLRDYCLAYDNLKDNNNISSGNAKSLIEAYISKTDKIIFSK